MKKTIPGSRLMLVSYDTLSAMSTAGSYDILQIEPDGLSYIVEVVER
jgi:hypothetical protein